MLTPRQELILCKVVEGYLQSGQPVASKTIAADPGLDCGPSTVRNELALLEEHDLLAHPHTSAGRVPTDAGHRYVVNKLLGSGRDLQPARSLSLSLTRREVEEAMRVTSAAISQVTNLLAVVSAPSLNTATIRHVEVLELQPQVVMVVVITSTGGVSKMLTTFDAPVDPGLVGWAGEYLNERLVGIRTRRPHALQASRGPRARDQRAGVRRAALLRLRQVSPVRARTRCTSTVPRTCSPKVAATTSRRSTS